MKAARVAPGVRVRGLSGFLQRIGYYLRAHCAQSAGDTLRDTQADTGLFERINTLFTQVQRWLSVVESDDNNLATPYAEDGILAVLDEECSFSSLRTSWIRGKSGAASRAMTTCTRKRSS